MKSATLVEDLKNSIANFKGKTLAQSFGEVVEVGDGIVRVRGLSKVAMNEMIEFETSDGIVRGIAMNLEEDSVGAVALGDHLKIREGDKVLPTGRVLSIRVGETMIGRVIDPLGLPEDGKGPVFTDKDKETFAPIEKIAPNVVDREPVTMPIHTGIKAIDAMIPIGRGQRELIIGDRQTGKTSIAIDTIIHQQFDTRNKRPICIYVAIGQKKAKVARIVATLAEKGAMEYTIVISAPASAPAALRYIAPYAGAAIGEYFMQKGEDALVVYDDLSKHAVAYREISLLLRRPPGREAYPGDIFYLHSRLLERAAKMSKEKGGGSLTALPIIETQLGDVSAYIPTNVISITDGQIYLESELFYQGVRPAVNVGLSVSRVGSSAQTKAMKKVAGRLRLDLAQFRELAAFSQFASDLDESTKSVLVRGRVLSEMLKQDELSTVPFEEEAALIFVGTRGFFDKVEPDKIKESCLKFLDFLNKNHRKDILDPIKTGGVFTEELERLLHHSVDTFLKIK